MLNEVFISSPLTGFTMHTASFCKPYSSRAEPIRLLTTNGFENRWKRFWDCPRYTSNYLTCSRSNSLKAMRLQTKQRKWNNCLRNTRLHRVNIETMLDQTC